MQIDVSRLPRPDEFSGVMTLGVGASPVQLPTDIKTVSYFIQPPETAANDNYTMTRGGFSDEAKLGGLVRREIDRAIRAPDEGKCAMHRPRRDPLEEIGAQKPLAPAFEAALQSAAPHLPARRRRAPFGEIISSA